MKIIKPSVQFFGAVPTDYTNTLRFIEMAGRTCYRSEDKITDSSAEGFVKRLIKSGHLAMVEHSNFVVRTLNVNVVGCDDSLIEKAGKYLNIAHGDEYTCIGGNLTAWAQLAARSSYQSKELLAPFHRVYAEMFGLHAGWENHWQICPHNEIPKALHRYSAKFICDRGVSHELIRHRPCSFAQESTRYVNYGGKDMEFIEPWWVNDAYGTNNGAAQVQRRAAELTPNKEHPSLDQSFILLHGVMVKNMTDEIEDIAAQYSNFEQMCLFAEELYGDQLGRGQAPQAARAVLPNALKTEIVVTADAAEWAHIKKLRTHPSAHPDMQRAMNMMPWEEMGL